MTRKQIKTRAKIAKMAGQDKRHFLNRNARYLKKPLGDIAGLTKLGFHLIEVPIGSGSFSFDRHICQQECIYVREGAETPRIGAAVLQVEAVDFTAYAAGREVHDRLNTGFNIF